MSDAFAGRWFGVFVPWSVRVRAAVELCLVLGLLELDLWWLQAAGADALRLPVYAAIIGVIWQSHARRSRLAGGGFPEAVRPARPPVSQAWDDVLLAMAVMAAALIGGGWLLGWWKGSLVHQFLDRPPAALARWVATKVLVVAMQQVGLCLFLLPVACELLKRRWPSIAASAAVFGLLHLPNLILTALTLLSAAVWCWLYLRVGRIVPLVVAHLLLAIVARASCDDMAYRMRVGANVLPLLPSTVSLPDGRSLRVKPMAIQGVLETCAVGRRDAVVSGWAADVKRSQVPEQIAVLAAGSLHRFPFPCAPRADVAAYYGDPDVTNSGFRLVVPAVWFAESSEVRIFAVAADGTASEVTYACPYRWRSARWGEKPAQGRLR